MRILLLVIALLLAAGPAPALAYDYSPAALAVLEQGRAAAGGGGWNSLRGWRETGAVNGVRYTLKLDPLRYGYRYDLAEGGGARIFGYNGVGEWEIAPGGQMTASGDKGSLARGRTHAFFGGYGFFFQHRFAAKGTHAGVRQLNGRSYDVLNVRPADGLLRELWFDRGTRLLARAVDRNGPVPLTWEFSDYRQAGPIRAPFRIVIDDGDPKRRVVRQVERIDFGPAERDLFSLPRPAAPVSR